MPDETPPPPEKSLRQLLEDRFKELRAADPTIRSCENKIATQAAKMRRAHQLRKLENKTIRAQEEWLREEAAAEIRKRLGIATIPGFVSKRESARAFRKQLHDRLRDAQAAARQQIPPG